MAMRNESHTKSRTWWLLREGGIFGKARTLLWLLNVCLKSHESFFASSVQKVIHSLKSVDIGLGCEFRAAENAADAAGDVLDDVKWIGNQERADRSTANDDEFGRLQEHAQIPMLHEITGDDATEDDDNADNGKT